MLLPHLKINPKDVPEFVLLPGDPGRVDIIGKRLDGFKILNQNREFRTGIGFYKKIKIMVCSTGIGGPSTAIAVEELISAGAKNLIRVGTCGGSWRGNVPNGSFIIPSASIRDEGTTIEYIPQAFPAVADFGVVEALNQASKKHKNPTFVGINRSHDSFYGSQESITKWGKYLLDRNWKGFDTPILSSDMECSSLFVIASLKSRRAGAILLANSNPEPLKSRIMGKKQKVVTESSENETKDNSIKMIQVVLDAIKILSTSN